MQQSVRVAKAGKIEVVSILPEDITALAAQVLEGLHGEFIACLEQFFTAHSHRLPEELKMERSTPSHSTSLLTSVRRLGQKNPVSSVTAQKPVPSSSLSFPPSQPNAGSNINVLARRLDPRAYFSTPVECTSPALGRKGLGWGNSISDRQWLAWWHKPSDMTRLEDARDSELLGEVPDHSIALLADLQYSKDEDTISLPQQDLGGTESARRDGQALAKASKIYQQQAMDTYNDVMNTLKGNDDVSDGPTKSQKPRGVHRSAKEAAVLPARPRQASSPMAGQPGASAHRPHSRQASPRKASTTCADRASDEMGILPDAVQMPNLCTDHSSSEEDLLGTVCRPADVTTLTVAAEGRPRRCFLSGHCRKQAEASCQEFIGVLHRQANTSAGWPARSHQLGEFDGVAKEASVAAEPAQVLAPMPLPERLPVPDGGLPELPSTAAQNQHLTEQLRTGGSSVSGEAENLPGVVQMAGSGQSCSLEEGFVHKTHFHLDLATAVPAANHYTSLLPAQHPEAERGRATGALAAAAAAAPGAAAAKDHPQGRRLRGSRTWSMSSARSHSELCSPSRCPENSGHTPGHPERSWAISSAAAAISWSARRSVKGDSDTLAVRLKREGELLDQSAASVPSLAAELSASPYGCEDAELCRVGRRANRSAGRKVRSVGSPLLLRFCGILPCAEGRLGVGYRCGALVLAACPVLAFGVDFYLAQSHAASLADRPAGVCFCSLSNLVLAVCSFLGLLAARRLHSSRLLGGPTALLVRCAVERGAVHRWSSTASLQSIYLAASWVASLALRAVAMAPGSSPQDVVRALSFVVSSLVFTGLVFGVLHAISLAHLLTDSYARSVQEAMDPARCIQEWDRLVALLRRVSRAVDASFLIVQFAAAGMVLCTFSGVMLQGERLAWRFVSDLLLAQSLVLIFFKTADVTEMCKRMPSLINSLDFDGDSFSIKRHYLVEHISYSAGGFYVGEVRLTAAMALRLLYLGVLAALSLLTRRSTA